MPAESGPEVVWCRLCSYIWYARPGSGGLHLLRAPGLNLWENEGPKFTSLGATMWKQPPALRQESTRHLWEDPLFSILPSFLQPAGAANFSHSSPTSSQSSGANSIPPRISHLSHQQVPSSGRLSWPPCPAAGSGVCHLTPFECLLHIPYCCTCHIALKWSVSLSLYNKLRMGLIPLCLSSAWHRGISSLINVKRMERSRLGLRRAPWTKQWNVPHTLIPLSTQLHAVNLPSLRPAPS